MFLLVEHISKYRGWYKRFEFIMYTKVDGGMCNVGLGTGVL